MKTKPTFLTGSAMLKRTVLIALLCFFTNHVSAQIENVIPYQGQITDTSGKGFDGNFDFSFKILDNGGATLWSSGTVSLDVFQGSYSVVLGKSPQPNLPSGLVSRDQLFLEIAFDDGVNGSETLSPNVQILPVPYALRASVADSAASSSGQLSWGDSLVLRDANGDIRFVINPNTGVFKAVQDDTAWYSLQVNSPPKIEKGNGDESSTEEQVEMNGKRYTKHTTHLAGLRIETFVQHDRDFGNQDTLEVTLVWDGNCLRHRNVKYYRVSTGRTREVIYSYDCPSGKVKGIKDRALDGDDEEGTTEENKETFTKTTKKTSEGRLQAATVDTRSGNLVAATFSPKDSCYIINADKLVLKNDSTEYMVKLNKDGTISTEARKLGGSNPPPPVMELVDPLEQAILERGMKQITYEYIHPELLKIYKEANLPDVILEILNASAGNYVSDGINTLQRLVDSVLVHQVHSKSVKDSIEIVYNAVRHVIETKNVAEYRQLSADLRVVRLLNQQLVVDSYQDTKSGNEIQRQTDLQNQKDVLVGAEGSDVIFDGPNFTEKYSTKSGSKSIVRQYDPNENIVRNKGVGKSIYEVEGSDTFTHIYSGLDGSGKKLNDLFVHVIPEDSLVLYDNIRRETRKVEPKGYIQTFEYDSAPAVIEERTNPADSSKSISGATRFFYDDIHTITRETGTGNVTEHYDFDANGNRITEVTSPEDSSKIYVGLTTVRYESDKPIVFEYDGLKQSSYVAHDNDNQVVINGGIKAAEWDFDTIVGGLYSDQTRGALNFTNTLNNQSVGIGFDPDMGAAGIIGSGKSTFVADTIMAFDQLRASSMNIGGNGFINGNLNVLGNISKGGGTFKIDHPMDPYNKYLYHSFIESPDMMNVYNGNTMTDSNGIDTVILPEYFGSLNKDFRYQLTCIGTFAQAIVLQEIEGNSFVVQTNKPNVKVSWQVTGIRKDTYANENRVEVEVEKMGQEKGTLLYPPKVNN